MECKGGGYKAGRCAVYCLNSSIVECKGKRENNVSPSYSGLNSSIVECKVFYIHCITPF